MANGKIVLGKQSGGTLGLVFPDGVSNTEVVLPESGELATKQYADLKVALTDFIGANRSLAENGYQILPGGLIIQWGSFVTANGVSTGTVTYPIAFPTVGFSPIVGGGGGQLSNFPSVLLGTETKASFDIIWETGTGMKRATWIVLGY